MAYYINLYKTGNNGLHILGYPYSSKKAALNNTTFGNFYIKTIRFPDDMLYETSLFKAKKTSFGRITYP